MNELDWVICAVIGFSAIISLFRGFVKEAISLLLWLFAFALAIGLSGRLAVLLSEWIGNPTLRQASAFALLFFSTLIVGGLIGQLLTVMLKRAGLGFFDRILGMVFGGIRGAVLVLVAVLLLPYAVAVDQQKIWTESQLIPKFVMMEDWAIKVFSDVNQWRLDVMKGELPG